MSFMTVSMSPVRIEASEAAHIGDVVVVRGLAADNYPVLSIQMPSADARRIAAELLAAADAVGQSLSSAPPDAPADSLPADGGAFSSNSEG